MLPTLRCSSFLARTVLLFTALLAVLLVLPALANAAASTRYVATTGSDTANDCTNALLPCATIGYALTQTISGDTVSVGAGAYAEGPLFITTPNVHLTGAGAGQTSISPDPLQMTYTAQNAGFKFAIITVGAGMGSVEIDNLSINGPNPYGNACGTGGTIGEHALLNFGLLVDGAATDISFHDANVTDIREEPLGNCQYDHAVRIRGGATGTVDKVNISGFQKTGLIVSGAGTNVEVKNSTVTGIAQQTTLLQNGVQISSDATSNFHDNTIKDVSCGSAFCGPDPWTQQQEAALLLFAPNTSTIINNNDISTSDLGIYARFDGPNASISNNNVHDNQFTGIIADGGFINLYFNTFKNNPIGVFTSTYSGQPAQSNPRYVSNNITGNDEGMVYQDDGTVPSTVTAAYANRIVGNAAGVTRRAGSTLTYDLNDNWWGCNAGPNQTGCDSISSGVTAPHWLMLAISAPSSGTGGTNVIVDTDARYNNVGDDVYTLLGAIPSTPITFGGTHADPSPNSTDTSAGAATYLALLDEQLVTAQVTSTLDNQTVSKDIHITGSLPMLNADPVASGDAQNGFTTTDGIWFSFSPITYTYQWQLCTTNELNQTTCADIPGETFSSFQSVTAMTGKQVKACVTATNWVGSVPNACSNLLPVTYLPPVNTTPPVAAGSAQNGFTATSGVWTGDGPITSSYQWQVCEDDLPQPSGCVPVPGATGTDLTAQTSWDGKYVRVCQTAANAAGGTVSCSNSVKVIFSHGPVTAAPVNTVAPTTSWNGATVSATTGVWTGDATIAFTYQWQVCDKDGSNCANIPGATDAQYTATTVLNGKQLRVQVTGTNAAGSSGATSTPTTVNVPAPPVNKRRPAVVGGAQATVTTLYADQGSWSGTLPMTFKQVWLLCDSRGKHCKQVSTRPTVNVPDSWVGKTVRLRVTATNKAGSATSTSLPMPIVKNSAGVAGTAAQGGCRPSKATQTVRLRAKGKITRATVTQDGHTLHAFSKKRSVWSYHVKLPARGKRLTVVRGRWNSTNPSRLSQDVWAFTTCAKSHHGGGFTG